MKKHDMPRASSLYTKKQRKASRFHNEVIRADKKAAVRVRDGQAMKVKANK